MRPVRIAIHSITDLCVVAVTGGRNYANRGHVWRVLSEIHAEMRIDVLVHGGATGADELADAWARRNFVQRLIAPVSQEQWNQGRWVGQARNRLMLAATSPSLLVAFPGNDGTMGCVGEAKRIGVQVMDETGGES